MEHCIFQQLQKPIQAKDAKHTLGIQTPYFSRNRGRGTCNSTPRQGPVREPPSPNLRAGQPTTLSHRDHCARRKESYLDSCMDSGSSAMGEPGRPLKSQNQLWIPREIIQSLGPGHCSRDPENNSESGLFGSLSSPCQGQRRQDHKAHLPSTDPHRTVLKRQLHPQEVPATDGPGQASTPPPRKEGLNRAFAVTEPQGSAPPGGVITPALPPQPQATLSHLWLLSAAQLHQCLLPNHAASKLSR